MDYYVNKLRQGISKRLQNEPVRKQEIKFCRKPYFLRKQVEIVLELIDKIPKTWGVPTLKLVVDPLQIYDDPTIRFGFINQIKAVLANM